MLRCFFLCLLLSQTLFAMTLEEKVGQLFIVHFNGEEANEEARKLIQELHVGGFIYYNWANGLHAREKVAKLSYGLQKLSTIPLLIGVDQEGGAVNRLDDGFTSFPSPKTYARAGDLALCEASYEALGQELKACGINMNFGPVVDIQSNVDNPVIGIRSFGSTPSEVIPYAQAALKGYKKAGLLTSLKHFPGHGDVETDSHISLPIVHKSREELLECELKPFFTLAKESDSITTAHVLFPALDEKRCATHSKPILELLRTQYQGVIITDSLVMEGLLKNSPSVEEAALRAFEAGCDMLLLGGKVLMGSGLELTYQDVKSIHAAFIEAFKSGRFSEKRLDQSVDRILAMKKRISPSHLELARRAIEKSVEVEKRCALTLDRRWQIYAPDPLRERLTFLRSDDEAETLLIFSYDAWKNPAQLAEIHRLLALGKKSIVVVTKDPRDKELFPTADQIYITYSPDRTSLEYVVELIQGNTR